MTRTTMLLAAALCVVGAAPHRADAAQYTLNYVSQVNNVLPVYTFAGKITIGDTADADGFFKITALEGKRNGLDVTLLPLDSLYNDNLFKPSGTYFNGNGVAFSVGGEWVNLFSATGTPQECVAPPNNLNCQVYNTLSFSVTPVTPSGVPEPATWGMMILGVGGVGFAMRRRAKLATRIRFA